MASTPLVSQIVKERQDSFFLPCPFLRLTCPYLCHCTSFCYRDDGKTKSLSRSSTASCTLDESDTNFQAELCSPLALALRQMGTVRAAFPCDSEGSLRHDHAK